MALWHSQGALNGPFCPRQKPTWRKASENSKLYFTTKTKDTNRMNPGSCSLLTLLQEQTFYQTFNFCRDDDFFLLPLNFSLHLYNCRPAAVPQMVVSVHYKSPQSHFLHIVRHFGSFQSIWLLKIKSLASLQMVSVDFAAKSNSAAKSTKALLQTLMAETGPVKIQAFCFPITKLIKFFNEGAVKKILNYYIACKRWLLAGGPEERRTRARLPKAAALT